MSIKQILTRILNTLKTLQDRDHIVEQGTEGIWTWRKYASGRAVCKGHTAQTSIACTTGYGTSYFAPKVTQAFPTGLFNNSSKVDVAVAVWSQGGLFNVAFETWTNTQMTYYVYSPKKETRNAGVSFKVEGTWK